MSGHQEPKPIGLDVLGTELVENQKRPQGNRPDKAKGNEEGSAKGNRKRPLATKDNKDIKEAAMLKIMSYFSPTLRKIPATGAVAAPKGESQKAQPPASQDALDAKDKSAQTEVEQVLAPLVNTQRGQARKHHQRQGDKLESINEDAALELQENCPSAPDVDAANKDNFRFCSYYAKRIYDSYREREQLHVVPENYLNQQDEEVVHARTDIVDWMIDTHCKMKMKMETLFLAISYMDRYLAQKKIVKTQFLTLAATCLFHAGKYEEMSPPPTRDIIACMKLNSNRRSTKASVRDAILVQEKEVFTVLEGISAQPTLYIFLLRYIVVAGYADCHEIMSYCCYLAELALYQHKMQPILPSKLATAIVLAARMQMNEWDLYPYALRAHTSYTVEQVSPIAQKFIQLTKSVRSPGNPGIYYVVDKYKSSKRHQVSIRGLTSIAKKRTHDPAVPAPGSDSQSRKFARVGLGARMRRE